MGAPTYLYNLGWRPSTLKAGDRITVKIAPLRKGGRADCCWRSRRRTVGTSVASDESPQRHARVHSRAWQ